MAKALSGAATLSKRRLAALMIPTSQRRYTNGFVQMPHAAVLLVMFTWTIWAGSGIWRRDTGTHPVVTDLAESQTTSGFDYRVIVGRIVEARNPRRRLMA